MTLMHFIDHNRTIMWEPLLRGIKVIGFGDLVDSPRGRDFALLDAIHAEYGVPPNPITPAAQEAFSRFLADHRVHYYARPAERFSEREAAEEAAVSGMDYVLMECLS